MNDAQCRLAVKQLLMANNEHLTAGLTIQGQQVWLRSVAVSGNTPPAVFPFVSVTTPSALENDVGGNTLWAQSRAEYEILVTVLNMAVAQPEDTTVYEESDLVHTRLCDRIIALFKDRNNRWLTEDESELKFELKRGAAINRVNFHSGLVWEQDTGYHSRLATEIRLTLEQRCTSDTTL